MAKIPQRLAQDLREAYNAFPTSYPHPEKLSECAPKRLFQLWCNWQGFIGWDDTIWGVVSELKGEPPSA